MRGGCQSGSPECIQSVSEECRSGLSARLRSSAIAAASNGWRERPGASATRCRARRMPGKRPAFSILTSA